MASVAKLGLMVTAWLSACSFPMGFLSDRLYAGIARRTFKDPEEPHSTLYGVTKVVKTPTATAWAGDHYPGELVDLGSVEEPYALLSKGLEFLNSKHGCGVCVSDAYYLQTCCCAMQSFMPHVRLSQTAL